MTTQSAVVATAHPDSRDAGRDMAQQISAALGGVEPDAVIVFASSRHDYGTLLRALTETCRPAR